MIKKNLLLYSFASMTTLAAFASASMLEPSAQAAPTVRSTSVRTTATLTTASPMPTECPVSAMVRPPNRESPSACDYLYHNSVPRDCRDFNVFYMFVAGTDQFYAFGVCTKPEQVYFRISGRTRSSTGGFEGSEFTVAQAEIGGLVAGRSQSDELFSFGSNSGTYPLGPPIPKGPGGGEQRDLLLKAGYAQHDGDALAKKYISEMLN